jgi:hypothetical protein
MKKGVFITGTLLLIGLFAYIYWFYYKAYGAGTREGYFQKFARKGNVFKTFEGELLMEGFGTRRKSNNKNFTADYFYFSVTDEKLADSLDKCIGKVIKLHYTQYLKNLPWRGDNYSSRNEEKGQFIVDRIELVHEDN